MTRKEKLARAAAVGADLALGAAPGAGAPSAGASSAGVLSASFEPDRLNILPTSFPTDGMPRLFIGQEVHFSPV